MTRSPSFSRSSSSTTTTMPPLRNCAMASSIVDSAIRPPRLFVYLPLLAGNLRPGHGEVLQLLGLTTPLGRPAYRSRPQNLPTDTRPRDSPDRPLERNWPSWAHPPRVVGARRVALFHRARGRVRH